MEYPTAKYAPESPLFPGDFFPEQAFLKIVTDFLFYGAYFILQVVYFRT